MTHQKFRLAAPLTLAFALALTACDQTGAQASSSSATPAAAATTSAPAAAPAAPVVVEAPAAPAETVVAQAETAPAAAPVVAEPVAAATGPLLADAPLGSPDAKVTVIEYASLTCPHCATFQKDTAAPFKAKYVDTGLVRFIYRDYPLNDGAILGALVARCDGSPQKYHAFIDLLMRQQEAWAFSADGVQQLKRLAQMGGLSAEKVDACIADHKLGQWVLDTAREGEKEYKINSTPTFVINGKVHPGSLSLEQLSAAIDPLLK